MKYIWFITLLIVLFTLALYYFTNASLSWWIFLSVCWGLVLVGIVYLFESGISKEVIK